MDFFNKIKNIVIKLLKYIFIFIFSYIIIFFSIYILSGFLLINEITPKQKLIKHCQRNLYLYGTIGMTAGPSSAGSLGIGTQNAAVTNSLGGASASHTVTAPTTALGGTKWYKNPLNAIDGYSFDPSNGNLSLLKGGAGDGTNYGGGVVVVCARYLSGDGAIYATASGNAGGGVVFLISSDKSHSYTLSAAGSGTGSAGNTYFLEAD